VPAPLAADAHQYQRTHLGAWTSSATILHHYELAYDDGEPILVTSFGRSAHSRRATVARQAGSGRCCEARVHPARSAPERTRSTDARGGVPRNLRWGVSSAAKDCCSTIAARSRRGGARCALSLDTRLGDVARPAPRTRRRARAVLVRAAFRRSPLVEHGDLIASLIVEGGGDVIVVRPSESRSSSASRRTRFGATRSSLASTARAIAHRVRRSPSAVSLPKAGTRLRCVHDAISHDWPVRGVLDRHVGPAGKRSSPPRVTVVSARTTHCRERVSGLAHIDAVDRTRPSARRA